MLAVAVLGGLAVVAIGARPDAEASFPVGVEAAHVGTTYAFDGVLCLGSSVAGSTVADVQVEQAPGSTTRLTRPVEGPPTLGIPVDPGPAQPAEGYEIPAGEQDCELRLLVTADRTGELAAGRLRLRLAYGPAGLLRRTFTLEPPVTLDATRTGPDTRADG